MSCVIQKDQTKLCASVCSTCPWLKANHGKPNPPGVVEARKRAGDDEQIYDWYSTENALRLWGGIKTGEVMLCHSTDSTASTYGGKDAKPGNERVCAGMMILVMRNLNQFGKSPKIQDYNRWAGKHRMTRGGIAAWVERIIFNGASRILPKSVVPADVGLPVEAPFNHETPIETKG